MNLLHLRHCPRCWRWLCLVLVAIALSVMVAQTATRDEEQQASEVCIRCHVSVYETGMRQPVLHSPFFERRCGVCHNSQVRDFSSQSVSLPQTGLPVDQQPLWLKQETFADEVSSRVHFATLNGLQVESLYRFRLQVGEQPGQSFATSQWLGLRLAEMQGAESDKELEVEGLTGTIEQVVAELKIQLVASDTVVISWQTTQPVYSWLELQLLEEVADSVTTADSQLKESPAGHPPLRDPTDLTIEACYQCHPESTLGTSHPVRLYGGRDVTIPEDLPTVDGMLTCVTCHDPHGAEGEMLVRETIKTKLCVACHTKFKNSSPSTMFN